jgi:hypothetical protein
VRRLEPSAASNWALVLHIAALHGTRSSGALQYCSVMTDISHLQKNTPTRRNTAARSFALGASNFLPKAFSRAQKWPRPKVSSLSKAQTAAKIRTSRRLPAGSPGPTMASASRDLCSQRARRPACDSGLKVNLDRSFLRFRRQPTFSRACQPARRGGGGVLDNTAGSPSASCGLPARVGSERRVISEAPGDFKSLASTSSATRAYWGLALGHRRND